MVLPYINMNPPQVYMGLHWVLTMKKGESPLGFQTSMGKIISLKYSSLLFILTVVWPESKTTLPEPYHTKDRDNETTSVPSWLMGGTKGSQRNTSEGHIPRTQYCELNHVWLFAIPWTVVHNAPLSMGFPRQEYWSGLPFPPPRDLPHRVMEPLSVASPASAIGFFTTSST